MFSYPFYIFFLSITFASPFLLLTKRYKIWCLFPLLLNAQFNVTSFIKLGLTFSFFEVSLFLTVLIIILGKPTILKNIKLNRVDLIFIAFLTFSFLSIFIAYLRIFLQDLHPVSLNGESPAIRSIMSLNKVIIFLPFLIIVRNFLLSYYDPGFINRKFVVFLVISGIFPALATLLQFAGIGFDLIHNNPSFSETFKIVSYKIERPVGLTNEASFLVFQLFFPFIAVFEAKKSGLLDIKNFYSLVLFFMAVVIISLSRTGLVFYFLFLIYNQFRNGVSFRKLTMIGVGSAIFIIGISFINIGGFNVYERLLTSFNVEADLSTIERYGSSEAILYLIYNKALLFGVGIYNYGFYIMEFLPSYTDIIPYGKDRPVPSFNFILQLIAEFGLPLFLLFMGYCISQLRKSKDFLLTTWFLFLFMFALTFQVLNFSIPFLILLYCPFKNEDPLYTR